MILINTFVIIRFHSSQFP